MAEFLSVLTKSLLGVITALVAYLTPVLKKYLNNIIMEKELAHLDSVITSAIKSNLFLLDYFYKDKKLSPDEEQQFIVSVKSDVNKHLTIGKVQALKKDFDLDSYIATQCRAAMLDYQVKHTGGN